MVWARSTCGDSICTSLVPRSGPDQHVGIACCTRLVPRLSPCPSICFYFFVGVREEAGNEANLVLGGGW